MFFDLFHKHYWGPPRKKDDGRHYMTCYECGKSRRVNFEIEDEPTKSKQSEEKGKKAA